MSKIICDVCGTSYPETATQCPICGCVRPVDVATVNVEDNQADMPATGTYTYVKGGRFSKANVRKRNSETSAQSTDFEDDADLQPDDFNESNSKADKGLIVAIVLLVLAIISVVIYIALHFFAADDYQGNTNYPTSGKPTTSTQGTQTGPTVSKIPCTNVVVSQPVIEFDKVGAAYLLNVTPEPANTTETVTFSSNDQTVATVTDGGKVIAVGSGETIITISCGTVSTQCRVVCNFAQTPGPNDPTTNPTVPTNELKLNREDFTLHYKGQTWMLYSGSIPVKEIVWTSDDEKVVTIANGVVTAVGTGRTNVHGEYNGVKVSCIVRCGPDVGQYEESSPGDEVTTVGNYSISHTDVTLALDNDSSFVLKLLDTNKKAVEVTWTVADETICSVSGNTVTGLASGNTTVSVTYEGVLYQCRVYVINSRN